MPRPPRIDFPGALHHVTNRGVRGINIFRTEDERNHFLKLLDQNSKEYELKIYAYCTMSNHFHLVLESVSGRVSEGLGNLESTYAEWFNKRVGEKGSLFQSRFNSELIEDGTYFETAIQYVLTNPLRANLSNKRKAFNEWSSLKELKHQNEDECFRQIVDWVGLFEKLENVDKNNFHSWLRENADQAVESFESDTRRVRDIRIFGSDKYLEQILEKRDEQTRIRDMNKGPVDTELLLNSVVENFNFDSRRELFQSVGDKNRSIARFCTYKLLRVRGHCSLQEIAQIFDISEAAVSDGLRKLGERIQSDEYEMSASVDALWNDWGIET